MAICRYVSTKCAPKLFLFNTRIGIQYIAVRYGPSSITKWNDKNMPKRKIMSKKRNRKKKRKKLKICKKHYLSFGIPKKLVSKTCIDVFHTICVSSRYDSGCNKNLIRGRIVVFSRIILPYHIGHDTHIVQL